MGIQHPNSTNYTHPNEPNLLDLHKAMEYDAEGKPVVRVEVKGLSFDGNIDMNQVEITNDEGNPIPVSANTSVNADNNPLYVNVVNEVEIKNDVNNPLPVSFNTDPNSYSNPLWMGIGDSANLTAFARLKVAEARVIGDYRYMYSQGTTPQMNDYTTGSASLTADYTRDCFLATVTGSSGSRAVRQTKKYHPYISGTSNTGLMTFVMNAPKIGLVQAVGLFDDNDGVFFRMNGITPEFVIRKAGVDTEIAAQSTWNLNKLLTLDFTKAQILIVDYQWLGVGRVRIGFVDNGFPVFAHQFVHNSIITEVYMIQPSLPVRYEIYNSSNTGSSSTLMIICAAVYVEGSLNDVSYTKAVSNGTAGVSTSNSTDGYCALALKLQNTLVSKPNRTLARIRGLNAVASTDVRVQLVIFQDVTALSGTPLWTNVPGYSWCQSTNGHAMTAGWASLNNYWVVKDTHLLGSGGNNSTVPITPIVDNINNAIYQNYDSTSSQMIALIVYGSATVKASFEWVEEK